jgi:hypothetical protein
MDDEYHSFFDLKKEKKKKTQFLGSFLNLILFMLLLNVTDIICFI